MTKQQEIETAVAKAIAFRLNPVQWIGGDGSKTYDVSNMDNSHIENCIRMMRNGRMKRKMTNGINQQQWVQIFKNELIARRFKAMQ